eukprot:CAMPEP_0198500364 /NCGR_PEP_ID=MMETSP1462-20131121/8124_1 /TAXON_ID=1333877 /ORGANISM="Brandtodinium nutriculum, Strain RCC3387" /LENGTH=94 /DNA_ID=CAMNT_0044229373 /DNA_START=528 /DNA_END=809 /DNA_ORIENTATION=+
MRKRNVETIDAQAKSEWYRSIAGGALARLAGLRSGPEICGIRSSAPRRGGLERNLQQGALSARGRDDPLGLAHDEARDVMAAQASDDCSIGTKG